MARYTAVADQRLTAIQDKYLQALPGVQFAITIDPNHYLAAHNSRYSKPQGPDPVWNAANCRNRIFYSIRASVMAERSPKDLRLSTMRRDLGNGQHQLMKVASCRIYIEGRRWGRTALGYISS